MDRKGLHEDSVTSQIIKKNDLDSMFILEVTTVPLCVLARCLLSDEVIERICRQVGVDILEDGRLSGTFSALGEFHKVASRKLKDGTSNTNTQMSTTLSARTECGDAQQFAAASAHDRRFVSQHRNACDQGNGQNASTMCELATELSPPHYNPSVLHVSDIKIGCVNDGSVFSYTLPVEELLMQLLYRWHAGYLSRLEQVASCSLHWNRGGSRVTITSTGRDELSVSVLVFSQFYEQMSSKMLYQSVNGLPAAMEPMLNDLNAIHNLVVAISVFHVRGETIRNALLYGTRVGLLRAGMHLRQFLRGMKVSALQSGTAPLASVGTGEISQRNETHGSLESYVANETASPVSFSSDFSPTAAAMGGRCKSPPDVTDKETIARQQSIGTDTAVPTVVADQENMAIPTSRHDCPICYEPIPEGKECELPCCHKFCRECIEEAMRGNFRSRCPACMVWFGVAVGNQPESGCMSVGRIPTSLPGYDWCGTIVIRYVFEEGIQRKEHPHPGKPFAPADFTAFLPDYAEGEEVLEQLREAFRARSIFTVGRSAETGLDDQILWADIPHKTSFFNGPKNDGYPDPDYLQCVKRVLAAKGFD